MICLGCSFENPHGFRFCGGCGVLLQSASLAPAAGAERRNITVVFCDLVGSTELSERLDDESFRDLVRSFQSAATAGVEKFGGHVAQHLGDGLLAYFGFPVAQEEDPRRAVLAGLEICAAISDANATVRETHKVTLAVRIGIHTGPAIAGDVGAGEFREQLVLGRTPNIAARVQSCAPPGSVVVSEDTWRLVDGLFVSESLGPVMLKGLASPIELHRVLKAHAARTAFDAAKARGLAELVGRQGEMMRLQAAFSRAERGAGGVVAVCGEPGIGKSRLADAFRGEVELGSRANWLVGQCSPYDQASPYGPLVAMLAKALGVSEHGAGDSRAQATRIADELNRLELTDPEWVSLVCDLLRVALPESYPRPVMTPFLRKERTLDAICTLIARLAAQRTAVVLIEDLHWADPSTLECLALLSARCTTLPVLLYVTFRQEFHAPWLHPDAIVTLDRLTADESRALVKSTAGGQLFPERVYELLHTRTDGIPLFVEELTKTIMESGVLDGAGASDSGSWEAAIPGSLRDSLAARLDRLGPARRIAQVAAVIGRDFGHDLLSAVLDGEPELVDSALGRLTQAGLTFREGSTEPARFSFKHALVRDAAYDSLLRPARESLHGRVAAVIRERFPELTDVRPDLVAHHMSAAGERAAAIPLWLKAGKQGMDRSANVEAVGFLSRGIDALADLPEGPSRSMQELELQMTLASAAMLAGGYGQPQVKIAFARAHTISADLGSPPQLYIVYFGLWMYYVVTSDLPRAFEVCGDMSRMAEQIGKPGYQVEAHFCTAYTEYYSGQLHAARQHFQEAIALERAVTDQAEFRLSPAGDDVRIHSRAFLAMTEWHLGLVDTAVGTAEDAVRVARDVGYPYGLVWGLDSLAWVHVFRGDPVSASAAAMEMIGICRERGFPFFTALGGLVVGWSAMRLGDVRTGLPMYEQSLAGLQLAGAFQSQTLFFAHLASAYLLEGRMDEADARVAQAVSAMDRTGERAWEPEVHLVRAAICVARAHAGHADLGPAIAAFAQARARARAQGALAYSVRACRLAAEALPRGEARDEALMELREVLARAEPGTGIEDFERARSLLAS